jgi:hypothetical protein
MPKKQHSTTQNAARTGHIWPWRRERLPVVAKRRISKQDAESYPCPGSAVCIIATIWLPESALRSVLNKIEDIRRARWAYRLRTMSFLVLSLCSAVAKRNIARPKLRPTRLPSSGTRLIFAPGWHFGGGQLSSPFAQQPCLMPQIPHATVVVLGSFEPLSQGESERSVVVLDPREHPLAFQDVEDYLRTDSSVEIEQRGGVGVQAGACQRV